MVGSRDASAPTSLRVQQWFIEEVIPQRTAAAGFSGNRLWKGPMSYWRGNNEDPNGLCGDAAAYVIEAFFRKFSGFETADGKIVAMVLWNGHFTNHIANVLLPSKRKNREDYTYDQKTRTVKGSLSPQQYVSSEILRLPMLDLYYKKTMPLGEWWDARDSMGGKLTIAQYQDM